MGTRQGPPSVVAGLARAAPGGAVWGGRVAAPVGLRSGRR